MAENTNRYIEIDTDTTIGYNFLKGRFYITNKDTTTYREDVDDILLVADAIDIIDDLELYCEVGQTVKDLVTSFKTSTEELRELYYTWEDTGAYIKTIQLNDFKKYPLTIDCEKGKLYIMNSSIVYDLTLNESPSQVIIPHLQNFYRNTLGLEVTLADMTTLYSTLTSYYKPTCYNQINTRPTPTTPLTYNNTFILSNYDGESPAVYNCQGNPLNKVSNTPQFLGEVLKTDTTTNTITTLTELTNVHEGTTIMLSGTNVTISETDYTADGTYQVTGRTGTTIQVAEPIPVSYTFEYPTLYYTQVLAVTNMSRTDNSITFVGASILTVGDRVLILSGTSNNGYYTIAGFNTENSNIAYVEEIIPYDWSGNVDAYKETFVGNISQIQDKIITLTDTPQVVLSNSQTVSIYINGSRIQKTVQTVSENKITTTSNVGVTYTASTVMPKLHEATPSPEVKINVTYVEDYLASKLPVGEFIVDTFEQAQAYLQKFLPEKFTPDDTIGENMYQLVAETYQLDTESSINTMSLLGLYSEIYSDKAE